MSDIPLNSIEDIELLAESEDLECKKAGGKNNRGELPQSFWETYSAMANTNGGTVLLGITEKKRRFSLHGIEDGAKVKKELFDTANNRNKVSVNLLTNASVEEIVIDGHQFLRITIPRAKRQQRPVYLNDKPFGGNTYYRLHEADQRLSDGRVKRMLAEQVEDSRDQRILKGFDLGDLHKETLRAYRQIYANRSPHHPWNSLDDLQFLAKISAWRKDRESNEHGLTLAGLLMFGTHNVIQEALPFFMLDYQERPEAKTEKRWVDRVTLDGTWSGNLYDFYRKVYSRLTEGLKIPFELEGDRRKEETPAHVALREALCNVLVHADYSDRASVLVVKRPDMFGFRNPGLMRVPVEIAYQGGHADCRNRSLHQMFRYVGIGDQAGSGVPKILSGWHTYHWRRPELEEQVEPYDQTRLSMRMLDLFPASVVKALRADLGPDYDNLPHLDRVALAIAALEGTVSHRRLKLLANEHPADASRCLRRLVELGHLEQTGASRGAVYHLKGFEVPGPEDVFDAPKLLSGSPHLATSSPHLTDESRDKNGCLISETHATHFVDSLDALSPEYLHKMERLAIGPRAKRRFPGDEMKKVLVELCSGHFVTLACLAKLVRRNQNNLRERYLSGLVKTGELKIAFPRTPNDPRQAYTASEVL